MTDSTSTDLVANNSGRRDKTNMSRQRCGWMACLWGVLVGGDLFREGGGRPAYNMTGSA